MLEILQGIMGTKDRTVEGYSIIAMAVKYIYDANKDSAYPWDTLGMK